MNNSQTRTYGIAETGIPLPAQPFPKEVRLAHFQPEQPLPLIISPTRSDLDLVTWAGEHREFIDEQLLKHGGILFRGFPVSAVEAFERVIKATAGDPLEYRERSSPRSQVSGNIYTSTDYPPAQSIFLHNEHSYSSTFPLRIFFFALLAPQEGGETPIADTRRVFDRIDPEIRERFLRKKWRYVRNFKEGIGLSWTTVFQTENRDEVEAYCRSHDIELEWKDEDDLRTWQVRPATLQHPQTGEVSWFNHATFFHVSTLAPEIRDALLETFAEEDLPNNTYYGDGSPIEPEVLEQLRAAYLQEKRLFVWQQGDILMLDNILVAHGREPYTGQRKITVGMAQPFTRKDV